MTQRGGAGVAACAVTAALCLTSCIAPDVEVIGALGVTVDDESRPVIVVEACDGSAVGVHLSYDREGLEPDETNEEIGEWLAVTPAPGTSELALHAPEDPWQGESVELPLDRGFVATGAGQGDEEVLSQVAFTGADLATMEPGAVYRSAADPDDRTLISGSLEEFSTEVCSRGS